MRVLVAAGEQAPSARYPVPCRCVPSRGPLYASPARGSPDREGITSGRIGPQRSGRRSDRQRAILPPARRPWRGRGGGLRSGDKSVALAVGGDVGLEATPAPTTDENHGRALGGTPASANCARTTVQSSMTVNKSGNSCTPQVFPGAIQILRSLQITCEMARRRHPLVDLVRTDEQPVCFGQGQISGTTRYCARPNRTASKRRHGFLQVLGAVVIDPDVDETCGRKQYGQGINNALLRFRKTVEKSVPVIVCWQTAADRIRTAERQRSA